MEFPTSRFVQAGATPEQIAQLAGEFAQMPELGQQSFLNRVAGLASADLLDIVAETVARDQAVAAEQPAPGTEPEPTQETAPAPAGITFSDGSAV